MSDDIIEPFSVDVVSNPDTHPNYIYLTCASVKGNLKIAIPKNDGAVALGLSLIAHATVKNESSYESHLNWIHGQLGLDPLSRG